MDLPHSPSSSSPGEEPCQWAGAAGLGSAACGLAGRVLCVVATCVFAAVGSVVGAVTGSMIGLATESGMLRGAGIGGISGAVFSIEVAEASRDLWHSGDSGVWTVLNMVDIISSLLSGRLVREKVGPAVQSAVQSQGRSTVISFKKKSQPKLTIPPQEQHTQTNAPNKTLHHLFLEDKPKISAISSPFAETSDLFETGGSRRGITADALRRLPAMEIAADSAVDAAGEAVCCPVCLQDFRVGESARRLPGCRHVFHAPCIDCWLVRHGSCPLCRRDI